jgi:hypothetical protein
LVFSLLQNRVILPQWHCGNPLGESLWKPADRRLMSHGPFTIKVYETNGYVKYTPAVTDCCRMNGKTYFESVPFTQFLFFMQDLFRFSVILPVNDVVNIFRPEYAFFM